MMPVFFYCGYIGMCSLVFRWKDQRGLRVLARSWDVSVILILAIFWGLGLGAYRQDVSLIQTEMVAAARWIAAETQPNALIAAHDIGAIGYFGQRDLLDLAGLVSPEMIPYLNNEASIRKMLDAQHVDYLVTFPGWYPQLIESLKVVYTTGGATSKILGGENMVVYQWSSNP
jgi:hypothetical protein